MLNSSQFHSVAVERTEPTTAAMHTPPGRGAVAVVLVDGPGAAEMVGKFFRAKSGRLADGVVHRIRYGRWGGEPAEDVVVCWRDKELIEIHCHGGTAAVKRLIGDLATVGAIETTWTAQFRRRDRSSIRAAARDALAKAVTQRTAWLLLAQWNGALELAIQEIVAQLANHQFQLASTKLDALLDRATTGLHLTQPWQVVIAGPPNVGKSSLMNALVGYERAIVFDEPGTTRDVVTATTAFDGWPMQLFDTAGLRASNDELESAGIERALAQANAAECLVLVFDATQRWTAENEQLLALWPAALVVQNKCDLATPAATGLLVSALTGAGIAPLIQQIVQRLVPLVPRSHDAVPFTIDQFVQLQVAAKHLSENHIALAMAALQSIDGTMPRGG
ncbi:MAG: 50S ribosome-binding GTPase [Pirellulales bacterium]|nr:50S ribosome-binding GTPase [Pirellulales bacterium]